MEIIYFLAFGFAEMSQETAVNPADIVSTLQYLQMLKYWKGKHLVLKRQVRLEGFPLGQPFVLNASFIFPNYMMLLTGWEHGCER